MDLALVIRQRLEEFGLDQRELAQAAQVTESYISQLLTRRKAPPAPTRTDIYDKMDKFLRLPRGELARLAEVQRRQQLRRGWALEPEALFREVRELILRKCHPDKEADIRAIFEREPFGELERLVTKQLLDVVKGVAKEELSNERWLRRVAELGGQSYRAMRVSALEFLDTDIFHLSREHRDAFLEPLIQSWDIDLATFALDIVLNPRVVSGHMRRFEFTERVSGDGLVEEPGLRDFLQDPALSGTATEEEIGFLKRLRFRGRRPTAFYYYRELQNLRDPVHFQTGVG